MRRNCITALTLLVGTLTMSAQELHLFSPEVHDAATYPQQVVMDFLERYFTELPRQKQTTIATKMADDKVYFRKGRLSDLTQIADTMPFSINLLDRYYEVKWQRQDEPFVTIVFPAQYDLLMGIEKDVAQAKLKDTVLSAPERKVAKPVPTDLQPLDGNIWQSKTGHYELESLNDAIYYNKVREDFQPVWDAAHLDYSAANLFHGLIADADYRMYVEQSVYGMKTVSYTLSLKQWLNYCAQLGLKVYFAVEEQRQDGLLCMVLVQSLELGFNHLLSVVVPDKFVADKNAVLKARLTPYIPTHNVKNLYKQETENHKKKKWQ